MLHSIRTKLIAAFLLTILIPISTIGTIVYVTTQSQLSDNFVESTNRELNQVDSRIALYFKTLKENVLLLANDPVMSQAKGSVTSYVNNANKTKSHSLTAGHIEAAIATDFQRYIQAHPKTSSAFLGTQDGGFVVLPDKEMVANYDPRLRPWYKQALEHPKEVLTTDPYVLSGTDTFAISTVAVVKDKQGAPLGVAGVDTSLEELTNELSDIKIGTTGYVMLLFKDGTILADPKHKGNISKNVADLEAKEFADVKNMDAGKFNVQLDKTEYVANLFTSKTTGWKYIAVVEQEELDEGADKIGFIIFLTSTIFAVLAVAVSVMLSLRITKPLNVVVSSLKRISEGDFTEEVSERLLKQKDEIGVLGRSLHMMQSSIHTVILEIKSAATKLSASSEQLNAHVDDTSKTVNSISSRSEDASTGAENQLRATEESSRAMEEMAIGIQRIAETTSMIAESSIDTTSQAEQGNQLVQQAVTQMTDIESSVHQSASIVNQLGERSQEVQQFAVIIKNIAAQTNLLALNASIEAARAGEHGKGFAVVAGEVRKLAEQSADSANEIARVIEHVRMETEQAIEAMAAVSYNVHSGADKVKESGEAFVQILRQIGSITNEIQEASAVSEEMSAGSEEVAASVEDIAKIAKLSTGHAKQIAAAAREQKTGMGSLTEAAEELHQMSQELSQLIERYKV
ncbi:methyl-accepting chemotaxis protein [Paenibacillus sp. ACRRX]|uniref:methyl-accepting chemotaxis protein n=1 Tax=unclassified Paenibacillus TaxID=185978 RepID=UPI001EF6C629|nr:MULTISPECIES: methyl-accepting chemotaxis protein [unclassified Paenibacillus]MCG7409632.1 methyl-accepting chemotaxis protein [Paenibacillus sp. ACRRX]MDK8183291.1 methyl-accepting chemotaxis protein [Paenibacillus sp. UMB4589-SE434]